MQVAPVHQHAAQVASPAVFKEHVIGHHDSRASARLQGADAMFDEGELVGRDRARHREVVARGTATCGAKRRICKYEVGRPSLGEVSALWSKRVGKAEMLAVDPVQLEVHQQKAIDALDVLYALESPLDLELLLGRGQVKRSSVASRMALSAAIRKPPVPAAGPE